MKRLLIALVKFYRRYISPLKPPCCRFIPTCSEYALEALQKYGALKGSWLAIKRKCRCARGWPSSAYVGAIRSIRVSMNFMTRCHDREILRILELESSYVLDYCTLCLAAQSTL